LVAEAVGANAVSGSFSTGTGKNTGNFGKPRRKLLEFDANSSILLGFVAFCASELTGNNFAITGNFNSAEQGNRSGSSITGLPADFRFLASRTELGGCRQSRHFATGGAM
jgi:hypothetical protein